MWKKNLNHRLLKPLKQRTRSLSGGERGNVETVQFMKRVARKESRNPFIRSKALEILQNARIPSHDEIGEALAIGQWVQRNIRYVKDPSGVEYLMNPMTLLDQHSIGRGMGDCDDMSLLIATLLLSIGHEPRFRTVRYYGETGPYDHIYVVDYARDFHTKKKKRVVLDAIVKDEPIGHEVSHVTAAEFDI